MSASQAATLTSTADTEPTGNDPIAEVAAPPGSALRVLADDLTSGDRTDSDTGRPLRADALRNQQRILDAVRELARTNPDEIVMEKVAKTAGVGIGTLYRRFPTRLALLEAAYRDEVAQLAAQAEELAATMTPSEALQAWMHRVGQYVSTKKAFLREQQDADANNDGSVMTRSREIITTAAGQLLAAAQAEGTVRSDIDSSDVMRLVSGCAVMTVDDHAQRDRIIDVVLDGLRLR